MCCVVHTGFDRSCLCHGRFMGVKGLFLEHWLLLMIYRDYYFYFVELFVEFVGVN